eukprot:1617271-Rhodomonas_salina.1
MKILGQYELDLPKFEPNLPAAAPRPSPPLLIMPNYSPLKTAHLSLCQAAWKAFIVDGRCVEVREDTPRTLHLLFMANSKCSVPK